VQLPWEYASPRGTLLLATWEGAIAGCVALREFAPNTGEMRRLYVRPEFRSAGIGRRLVEKLIPFAKATQYAYIVASTIPAMASAQHLYADLGFYAIEPYVDEPYEGVRYLVLPLN
jgi:putative acetyltransferase